MKIAIFYELHLGGAFRTAENFTLTLKKKHHVDVYVVNNKLSASKNNTKSTFFWNSGINLPQESQQSSYLRNISNLILLYRLHKKIAKQINDNNYDAVLVFQSEYTHSPFILRFLKGNTIFYVYNLLNILYKPVFVYRKSERPGQYLRDTFEKQFNRFLDKRNMQNAKMLLASSQFVKKGLHDLYDLNSTVCYPGIDTKFFSPSKIKKDIDLLFVGSLGFRKDEYTLFKTTLNFLPKETRVKIINVEREKISDTELRSSYQRAKLVVCTAHYQSLGLVPLEAGACGTPAVTVNEGGYRETIRNKSTGYLVNRDPIKLAGLIKRILHREQLLENLGNRAREYVSSEWSLHVGANRLESIISAASKKNAE